LKNPAFEEGLYMADSNAPEAQADNEVRRFKSGEIISVTTIERSVYNQFQQAAFHRYKQSILTYGRRLFREARIVAHQRDPNVDVVEITTPDVEVAIVRTEMSRAMRRLFRFPFRLIQLVVSIWIGILAKLSYDLAMLPKDGPGKEWFLWIFFALMICFLGIVILYHFETRAELLR
jgi:hypothetical protein